jgi:urease accessory protein UreE
MLRGFGAELQRVRGAFQPEGGAYGHGHHHHPHEGLHHHE